MTCQVDPWMLATSVGVVLTSALLNTAQFASMRCTRIDGETICEGVRGFVVICATWAGAGTVVANAKPASNVGRERQKNIQGTSKDERLYVGKRVALRWRPHRA